MKTVRIQYFKEKHQNRVEFVRILSEFNPEITLKPAKLLLDNMLDGIPIEYSISNSKLELFSSKLDHLNLEYEVEDH